MGFFSNIKNRARGMPMAPQPMQELRAGQIMPNSPQVAEAHLLQECQHLQLVLTEQQLPY
jgi:hypothetical protein